MRDCISLPHVRWECNCPVVFVPNCRKQKRTTRRRFWGRGHCVSTIGLDKEVIGRDTHNEQQLGTQQLELDDIEAQ